MSATTQPLLRTEDLTKRHHRGRPDEVLAVDRVSMEVSENEVVALIGPSGSGKTSLLSLVGCMSRPSSGRILVRGQDVAKLSETALTHVRRSTFGFVFQQFHLVSGITVQETVMLPLYPTDLGLGEMLRRARQALRALGLESKRSRRVSSLSGGEQQRVAIARALVSDPAVIVADEPTAHLDAGLAAELMSVLGDLHRTGRTILIASHDPRVFEHRLIGRCLSMRDGRIADGRAAA